MSGRYCGGVLATLGVGGMTLAMVVFDTLGDGADLALDLYDVVVDPSLGAVGSLAYGTNLLCCFI